MRANRAPRAIACIAALVAACASSPPERPQQPTVYTVVEPRAASLAELERNYRERAAALARDGRWAEARAAWEVLLLVDPDSSSYRQQYELAQTRTAELVAERLKAADKAREAGENEQATLAYLRVLSVDPRDAAAARALRELEVERVKRAYLSRPPRVVLANRSPERNGAKNSVAPSANDLSDLELGVMLFRQGDYAGSAQNLEKYLQKHARDESARGYLADAYYHLGLAAQQKGRKEEALGYLEKAQRLGYSDPAELTKAIRSVRQALGEEYYRLGVQAFGSSIDRAISMWERSVYFDPGQTQAQLRLQQARRARETMQSIEKSDKN